MATEQLTLDQLQRVVPATLRGAVTTEMVTKINTLAVDQEFREQYRENLLSYAHVLSTGKYKMQNYLDAVRYVSYKLMGVTNIEAYTKTFPEKYQRFLNDGVSNKDIASYVTAYNKSKLVMTIYEQSLIPSWVLNADLYQRALNVQAALMTEANSEKVRCDAANSILTHLKAPETNKIEIDIGLKKDGTIDALRQATEQLVAQQKAMILGSGLNAQQVAHSKLVVDGEVEYD